VTLAVATTSVGRDSLHWPGATRVQRIRPFRMRTVPKLYGLMRGETGRPEQASMKPVTDPRPERVGLAETVVVEAGESDASAMPSKTITGVITVVSRPTLASMKSCYIEGQPDR
jgi:hypothetical protein